MNETSNLQKIEIDFEELKEKFNSQIAQLEQLISEKESLSKSLATMTT